VKVRVLGTGSNIGSTLLCDLLSCTGVIAVVQVLGSEVRFRVADGSPCRVRKSWASAGWVLDVTTLPEMAEPSVDELAETPTHLSVQQLQQVYEHLSGRQSTSTNRTYLLARIKAAKDGTLPSGTRRAKSGEPVKVLPLGMPVSVVEAMDAAWKRNGFPSRIAFIRQALSETLRAEGEDEVAEMIRG